MFKLIKEEFTPFEVSSFILGFLVAEIVMCLVLVNNVYSAEVKMSSKKVSKIIRVAVIDTGLKKEYIDKAKLCATGHKSLYPGENLIDNHGHGTNIVGLIDKHAGDTEYCLIIIKFFSNTGKNSNNNEVEAFKHAYSLKPDIISFSGGGGGVIHAEANIVDKILNAGIILNVAAGNEGRNLDEYCNYYPACYDARINVVGAKDLTQSNYGQIVDAYIDGHQQTGFNVTYSGTSQSTAIFTGKMIMSMSKKRTVNGETEDALKVLGKATYYETKLNKKVKGIERRLIPKDLEGVRKVDDINAEGDERQTDKVQMGVLMDAVERYRIMSHVFFRRLDKDEKIEALIEAAELIRSEMYE